MCKAIHRFFIIYRRRPSRRIQNSDLTRFKLIDLDLESHSNINENEMKIKKGLIIILKLLYDPDLRYTTV